VGVIFDGKKGKRVDDTPAEGSKPMERQQKHKRGKKSKKPHRDTHTQGRDDDEVEALAVDLAHKCPQAAPRGPGVFDDMLKKPCPYHKILVNHTLEQCDMLKKYYSRVTAKEDEAKKDGGDGGPVGFPAVENVFLIFGGLTMDMSNSQRKLEQHEVLAAKKAPPSFLDWSEDAITFSREDHLNRIPNPGRYLLVVDLVIDNSRFSKVLMDGGNSLNILYAHTLQLMGSGWTSCGPAQRRSKASRQANASSPSGRSICQSGSAPQTISARKPSPSRWWASGAHTTPSLGVRATPSSWRSRTTPTSR
jgi:hypothetical protein